METPQELIKQLGELHSTEKEDLQWVIEDLNELYKSKHIDEQTISTLERTEGILRDLRSKYSLRLIRLLKSNIKV